MCFSSTIKSFLIKIFLSYKHAVDTPFFSLNFFPEKKQTTDISQTYQTNKQNISQTYQTNKQNQKHKAKLY